MDVTYKGPDGRLYRVSERPDAKGLYYIEYRDPAASAVYKPLPGYDRSTNRAEVVEWLGMAAQRQKWTVVDGDPAAKPAAPEKPKGTGVWLYGDHRVMRVGIGNDTDRSDCRYYHVLVLNLLAAKPQWRKLSGTGNYDHKHLAEADAELWETLPEDARELTVAEAEQLFTSPATDWVDLVPDADKAWDKIMAGTGSAAIAVPPAADIAAPGFDFGADESTNTALLQCAQAFVAGRLAQVMAAKRAHELTANNKNGAFGKWCEAVGISRDTGNNLVNIADNFGNIELDGRPLVEITPISLLAIASKPSAPLELKQGVESGDITTTKQYRELEAQLKAAEQAKEAAERETREALAWKQHAEGQAEDAKAAIHEAQQSAQEARRETEDLKQKLYRRNEELAKKEQMLNVTMDQQGMYIAKMQEQDEMLADLQDRLDDANAQLRNPQLEATVVDKDEVERRARELAEQKIAEALGAQGRQPMCDLVIALNDTISNAWTLSELDGREPESKYDDRALEVLYNTACRITDWAAGRLEPKDEEVTGDE